MPLSLACQKGCGGMIQMSDEVVKEALETGQPLIVAHEKCPNTIEEDHHRYFHIKVEVYERVYGRDEDGVMDYDDVESTLLASLGDTLEATSFTEVLAPMGTSLGKQWEKIMEMASVIDQG